MDEHLFFETPCSSEYEEESFTDFDPFDLPDAQPISKTTSLSDEAELESSSDSTSLQVNESDPSFIFSSNIIETRKFISNVFHIPISSIRKSDVDGLIVLSIKDLPLLRIDTRNFRIFPHMIYLPSFSSHPSADEHFELNLINNQFKLFSNSNK